jgi:hypothetical protein
MMANGDDLRVVMLVPKQWLSDQKLRDFIQSHFPTFKQSYQQFGCNTKTELSYISQVLHGFAKIYSFGYILYHFICILIVMYVLFCVLFVCKCAQDYCHRDIGALFNYPNRGFSVNFPQL